MSQNSEQIEAKLCAYLEGELDESGRAEIEKHLQQNPAHRKLLAEVGKTRDLLRTLPREPAPPDICEAFQGQLERSVLLADLDDDAGSSALKINRWPQYFAVAAVVMLAAGLGMVVYFGLPSGRPNQSYVIGGATGATRGVNEDGAATQPLTDTGGIALTRGGTTPDTPAKPTESLDQLYAQGTSSAGAGAGIPGQLARKNPSESAAGAQAPAASAPAAATTGDLTVLAKRVQGSWEPKERERLFTADTATAVATFKALGDVPDTALCYVVTTAQPAATAEQIGQQLSKLQVAWSAVPQPDPGAMKAKLGRMAIDVVGLESLDAQVTDTVAEQLTDLAQPPRGGGAGGGEPPRPEAVVGQRGAGAEARDGTAVVRKQDVSAAGAAGRPLAATRGPSTRPASDEATAQDKPAIKLTEPPVTQAYAYAGQGAARPETMIVARGLTREQADSLQATFGARQLEQQAGLNVVAPAIVANEPDPNAPAVPREEAPVARRMAMGTAVTGPTTAPADEHVIRRGDSLRLVMARDRGEQTVTEQQVRADGSVSIPGVGAFKCEGLTVGQLNERLASQPRNGTDNNAVGKLVEVTKVAPANDAAKQQQAMDVDAVAAVTEADAGRRGMVRAREEVALRSRAAQAPATPAQAPAAAAHPAPAPSAAPSTGQARGGAAGAGGVVQREAISPTAGATVAEMKDAETFGEAQADRAPATGPAGDRFDVVILVRADAGAATATTPLASENSGESAGRIEKYEILTIQLGEAEADAANVRVGEDGTVELPKVGRVKAEGLTADDLRKEITEKLRSGNAAEAESAKVAVKRVSGADGGTAARDAEAKRQPSSNETPAPGAASKPADSAAPADTAK